MFWFKVNVNHFWIISLRHAIDIQKIKDMHEAAEKLRRERWIQDKTKKIKVV